MNSKWSGITTLSIFMLLTGFGFTSIMLVFSVMWIILKAVGINTDYWAMTEALATAGAASAVLGAGFIAYRELAEISSSRHMEIADRLFEELNSLENINARRWVYQKLPIDPKAGIEALSTEGQISVKRVLNSLDRVAFLTQSNWIPDEIIMPWMHPMVAKSWEKLSPYLDYERERRNEPYFYIHVSKLAERCKIWRTRNLHDTKINWIEDAL